MALGAPTAGISASIRTTINNIRLVRVVLFGSAGLVLTLLVGKFSLLPAVKLVDEALFNAMVPALQSVPGLVEVCTQVTKMGSVPVNYGMAIGIGFYGGLQRRSLYLPLAVIGSLFTSHVIQRLVIEVVQGYSPTEFAIGGSSGPFFSGGVVRTTLMVGIAATLALPPTKDRLVWMLAICFGTVEGFTRLTLGRHWPIDIVAAVPIGLGILWLFRQAVDHWRDSWRTRATD